MIAIGSFYHLSEYMTRNDLFFWKQKYKNDILYFKYHIFRTIITDCEALL